MSYKKLLAGIAVSSVMLFPLTAFADFVDATGLEYVSESATGTIIDLKAAGCDETVCGREVTLTFTTECTEFGGGIMFSSYTYDWQQSDEYFWCDPDGYQNVKAEYVDGAYELSFYIPEYAFSSDDFEDGDDYYAKIYLQQWWGYDITLTDILIDGISENLSEGWNTEDGHYLYVENGRKIRNQWKSLKGQYYFFDSNGYMAADEIKQDNNGNYYYFFLDGTYLKNGWYQTPSGSWVYAFNGGKLASGLNRINGNLYYFREYSHELNANAYYDSYYSDNGGVVQTGWFKRNDVWRYADSEGVLASGLTQIGKSIFYFEYDGAMVTSRIIEDDEELYYFDKNGYGTKITPKTNGWLNLGDTWAYFEDGTLVRRGVRTINGVTYGFDYGILAKNKFVYIWDKDDVYGYSYEYYFDANGVSYTGWIKDEDGDWAYCVKGKALSGLQNIGGKNYYFKRSYCDGCISYKMISDEEASEAGKWYYADKNGVCSQINGKAGWVKENGKWYYYSPTKRGKLYTGHQYIDDEYYYFDKDGVMQTGLICTEYYVYYASTSGKLIEEGWISANGKWYYIEYSYGRRNGFYTIDNKKYYFDENSVMQTGWIAYGDNTYYASASGAIVTGWFKVDGKWYYAAEEGICKGPRIIADKAELFDENGIWLGTKDKTGWYQVGKKWCYLDKSVYGYDDDSNVTEVEYYWYNRDWGYYINGTRYIFDDNGWLYTDSLVYIYSNYYYSNKNGEVLCNQWQEIDGKWYYFGEYGQAVNGWRMINNKQYHFTDFKMDTGYLVIDDEDCVFSSQGVLVSKTQKADGWLEVDGVYYYYKNGHKLKGIQIIDGSYYYFNTYDGGMYADTVIDAYYNDHWGYYHIDKNGRIVTSGWYYNNSNKCYYYLEGLQKEYTGLRTISGKKYYFYSNGKLLQENAVVVNYYGTYNNGYYPTELYRVNKDGVVLDIISPSSAKGWVEYDGDKFYSDGNYFYTGICKIDGVSYYLLNGKITPDYLLVEIWGYDMTEGYTDSNGVFYTNGSYYGLKFEDGDAIWGENVIDGKYYFSQPDWYYGSASNDSEAAKKLANLYGIYKVDGNWYIYDGKGNKMKVTVSTGWIKYDGYYYYMKDGEALKMGYLLEPVEINGKLYHFDYLTGRMYANEDYNGYHFDASGAGHKI